MEDRTKELRVYPMTCMADGRGIGVARLINTQGDDRYADAVIFELPGGGLISTDEQGVLIYRAFCHSCAEIGKLLPADLAPSPPPPPGNRHQRRRAQ